MTDGIGDIIDENAYLRDIIANLTGSSEEPIDGLTRMQSRLVRTLQAAHGRILSRDLIIDGIHWDKIDQPYPQIVRVMIHKIKHRRPDIGAHILNVWGYGYYWEVEA